MKRTASLIALIALLIVSCTADPAVVYVPGSSGTPESVTSPLVGYWVGAGESLVLRGDGTATYISGSSAYVGSWSGDASRFTVTYRKAQSDLFLADGSAYSIAGHRLRWSDPYTGQYHSLYSTDD